jgi:hypothetical protein
VKRKIFWEIVSNDHHPTQILFGYIHVNALLPNVESGWQLAIAPGTLWRLL